MWSTQPDMGVSADYSSNPGLQSLAHTAESHAALLLDAPTTYNADAFKVTVNPSLRISDSRGYSSLASNYARLEVAGELDSERNSLNATAGIARDSTLYRDYTLNGSLGVRRDTATAGFDWGRALTARVQGNLGVNSQQVRYAQATGVQTLTDYRYSSVNPTLYWRSSELTKLTVLGSYSRYQALDGMSASKNSNLQFGFERQITALWSFAANAGISHANNSFRSARKTFDSSQNGTVFSAQVIRQGDLLALSAAASRQLTPSGFAFLSRQDSYQLTLSYPTSERWTLSGYVQRLTAQDPQVDGPPLNRRYLYLGLTAVWRCTEFWTVTFKATRVSENVGANQLKVAANGVGLELSRRLNRIQWR